MALSLRNTGNGKRHVAQSSAKLISPNRLLLRSIGPKGGSGRFGAPPGVAAVVIIAFFVSAYPLTGQKFTTVLLRPGLGPNSALELAAAVDARLVGGATFGELAVLQADANIGPLDLFSYGAMFCEQCDDRLGLP